MEKPRYLRTSDIAKAVGVHPNTVRRYEEWGFLPPIPRSPSAYRLFTEAHLEQMRLGRMALHGQWPGKNIRESALALVRKAASGDLDGALEQAKHHLTLVQAERAQAEAAAEDHLVVLDHGNGHAGDVKLHAARLELLDEPVEAVLEGGGIRAAPGDGGEGREGQNRGQRRSGNPARAHRSGPFRRKSHPCGHTRARAGRALTTGIPFAPTVGGWG